MYTSVIGKRFLDIYNKGKKKKVTAKEYFINEQFPLFYNHKQYLQSPIGTPFFQLIAMHKTGSQSERKIALEKIIEKIEVYKNSKEKFPEMSFAVGFSSADLLGTTSGQVSAIELPLEEEDIYASWIGAAFGVGIAGGLNLLIDNEEILEAISEGWEVYREFVDENKGIDNKIETWNGVWLAHRYSEHFKKKSPLTNFHPISSGKDNNAQMERPSWTNIILTLSKIFPKQTLNAYAYSLGQMNRTVGFIRLILPEVHKIYELYDELFGKTKVLSNKELSSIYESEYGLSTVCERFSMIGLRAFEPKDLKKYMPGSKEFPKLKDDEKSKINYSIYITWVIAMLNNKELLDLAEKAAIRLKEFKEGEKKVRLNRSNLISTLLDTKKRKDFIDCATDIVKEDKSMSEFCNELINRVMLDIAPDQLNLFVTLLRFKYSTNN
jgi:hypothetical protein